MRRYNHRVKATSAGRFTPCRSTCTRSTSSSAHDGPAQARASSREGRTTARDRLVRGPGAGVRRRSCTRRSSPATPASSGARSRPSCRPASSNAFRCASTTTTPTSTIPTRRSPSTGTRRSSRRSWITPDRGATVRRNAPGVAGPVRPRRVERGRSTPTSSTSTVIWDSERSTLSACSTTATTRVARVMNDRDPDVPYTRVTEHKHFAPWKRHHGKVTYRGFSRLRRRRRSHHPIRLCGKGPAAKPP